MDDIVASVVEGWRLVGVRICHNSGQHELIDDSTVDDGGDKGGGVGLGGRDSYKVGGGLITRLVLSVRMSSHLLKRVDALEFPQSEENGHS